jgi:hypothetical protein
LAGRRREPTFLNTLGKLTRRDLVLAVLASSEGRPYTPAQLQKAVFHISRNLPQLIHGVGFNFVLCDYGPFDSDVYQEAENLRRTGRRSSLRPTWGGGVRMPRLRLV